MRLRATAMTIVALVAGGALGAAAPAMPAAASAVTVTPINFIVKAGPGDSATCTIVADMYRPAGADAQHPVPVILNTHGFGESKSQDAAMMQFFAEHGYGALAYSGLGFGGSSCKVTLDNPAWDGRAASQLIDFLGGTSGFAFADADHTIPVTAPDWIVKDRIDHDGNARADDPRVGMFGASYGGGIQFATAKVDKRLDAIVPMATWNDLRHSLFPNTADIVEGVTSSTPGISKTSWGLGFDALGVLKLVDGPLEPYRVLGCPNWTAGACEGIVAGALLGYPDGDLRALLAESSVATFAADVTIPTLLVQGEADTLFTLDESRATYDALRSKGTVSKLIWVSGGHSGPPIGDDYSLTEPDPARHYVIARTLAWFDRYLRGRNVDTGPAFAYFRPWAYDDANPAAAYADASRVETGSSRTYYLSEDDLVPDPLAVRVGLQSFVTGPAAAPTNVGDIDLAVALGQPEDLYPDVSLPGTYAAFSTAVLDSPVRVVGSPVLEVRLVAPLAATTAQVGPTGMVALYAKLYDVGPDGTRTLINNLRSPFRVADASKPVQVILPAIVHEFDVGHRLQLEVAGGDLNFRGSLVSNSVTIATGDLAQSLRLPTVP